MVVGIESDVQAHNRRHIVGMKFKNKLSTRNYFGLVLELKISNEHIANDIIAVK